MLTTDEMAIATIDALEAAKWKGNWGVDALDVGWPIYVNSVDTHIDGDYMQWYLVEVCERDYDSPTRFMNGMVGPSTTGETWVSYLAVYEGPLNHKVNRAWEWHPSRNPFFDRETTPIYDIRLWFLRFVEDTPGKDDKLGWG